MGESKSSKPSRSKKTEPQNPAEIAPGISSGPGSGREDTGQGVPEARRGRDGPGNNGDSRSSPADTHSGIPENPDPEEDDSGPGQTADACASQDETEVKTLKGKTSRTHNEKKGGKKSTGKVASKKKSKSTEEKEPVSTLLPFEVERDPVDWTDAEKQIWINTYRNIINKAITPYRKIVDVSYLEDEDLWQTAMEVTLHCFEQYDRTKNTKLSTYVYKSITNEFVSKFRAINSLKRKGDMYVVPLSDLATPTDGNRFTDAAVTEINFDFSQTDSLHAYPPDMDTHISHIDLIRRIHGVLNSYFKPEEREIFLRCAQGESQIEIAEDFGMPQATICGINRRVKMKLLTYLRRNHFIEESGYY